MEDTSTSTITEFYVVIGQDANGNEGVASTVDPVSKIMKPLIGGESRVEELVAMAKAGSMESGLSFDLVKFTSRKPIMSIHHGMAYDELEG